MVEQSVDGCIGLDEAALRVFKTLDAAIAQAEGEGGIRVYTGAVYREASVGDSLRVRASWRQDLILILLSCPTQVGVDRDREANQWITRRVDRRFSAVVECLSNLGVVQMSAADQAGRQLGRRFIPQHLANEGVAFSQVTPGG